MEAITVRSPPTASKEEPPLTATTEKPHAATKTQRSQKEILFKKYIKNRECPGGPVVRDSGVFTAEGVGSIPGWGTKILQAVQCS